MLSCDGPDCGRGLFVGLGGERDIASDDVADGRVLWGFVPEMMRGDLVGWVSTSSLVMVGLFLQVDPKWVGC